MCLEKPIELLARLLLIGGGASTVEALRPRLRRDERSQIDELSCLQCDQLVAGLSRLQDADGRLARGDERIGLGARRVEVPHRTRLDPQRILVSGQRVLPACLGITDELL